MNARRTTYASAWRKRTRCSVVLWGARRHQRAFGSPSDLRIEQLKRTTAMQARALRRILHAPEIVATTTNQDGGW